ncbi:hypothetical protein ONS96_011717 [Cadophora gregata f. sp. sojae]|nr:hypothetical protein ONS96_011717 [Cadophora gregata f. sp. sojae]
MDYYKDINQLLRSSRRTPVKAAPPTPPTDEAIDGEMGTKDTEPATVVSEPGNAPTQAAAYPRTVQRDNIASDAPLVVNGSTSSTPYTQPRVAKRPASPSMAQNGSSKRQQIRANSLLMLSPSRPLSNGPVDTLFGMGMDRNKDQMSTQQWERSGTENCKLVEDVDRSPFHQSDFTSVNGDGDNRRPHDSRPASDQQTPSQEYTPARQTPFGEYVTPSRQPTFREQYSSQKQNQPLSRLYHTPQQHPPQNNNNLSRNTMRMSKESFRRLRALSVSNNRGFYNVHQANNVEESDMDLEDGVVRVAMARAASMMRESVQAQSRPPCRGSTAPPEVQKGRPLHERLSTPNVDRIMKATNPGDRQPVREVASYASRYDRMSQNRNTPRPASRPHTPKAPAAPFELDLLDDSSDDELEEKDMRSFFRRPNHNQEQKQPQGQSPYRRAQTAVPESPQTTNPLNRANTPKTLQHQSEPTFYAARQPPHLQSPIWASGAERKTTGSIARAHSAFDAFGFVEEKPRSRSRSIAPRDIQEQQRSRSRSVAPRGGQYEQRGRGRSVVPHDFQNEQRGRSRSLAPRTPAIERVRAQSQYGSPRNVQIESQARESEEVTSVPSRSQILSHQQKNNVPNGVHGSSAITATNSLEVPKEAPRTPSRATEPRTPLQTPHHVEILDVDSPETFHTPLDVLIRKNQQQPQPQPAIQNGNDNQEKVSSILPSSSAFTKKVKSVEPKIESVPITPKDRPSSGRGFAAPEVIDLITPEALPRSIPMNERLAPVVKKTAPKKTVAPSNTRSKASKPAAPPKRVAKEKPTPIDPEEVRQKKIAELIIDRMVKSDEASFDLSLFGDIVYDQEAEDKKAEEARAKGQRDREAKMAAMLAKEEAAKKAAAEEQAKRKAEAEKRKREKEFEEEQKRIKREADRQRQLAHENREKEMLRKAAEERIKVDREKKAKEEQQRELERQEAKEKAESVQAETRELAKLKAKKEQAKLQAASLSAAKLTTAVDLKPVEEPDAQMEDEDSLFMPEAPPVVPHKAKPFDRSGVKESITKMRADKEAEDVRKKLEQSQRIKEKLDIRYKRGPNAVAQNPTPAPRPKPSVPAPQSKVANRPDTVVEVPKPASQSNSEPEPEPVVEKPKPTTAPLAKNDRPAPKPKAIAAPKPKTARDRMNESLQSRSSSSSIETTPAPSYLDQLAAKNIFKGMPKDFSSFGRTKSKPTRPKLREHRHQTLLISDLEREELEKAQKGKGARVGDYRLTEERKQKEAKKRTEMARERKEQAIRKEAEKNGTQISEEELNSQVEAFMEKRAKELQKRAENKARKEQDPGHDFGRDPLQEEPLTAAQQLFRDTEVNGGLSPEEFQVIQNQRDEQAARAAYGKIRNNAFDRASARTTVDHFTDSEESEEDPDPEPEVESSFSELSTQHTCTETGESSRDETSSESETEEEVRGMSPMPEMSDTFTEYISEAELDAREKRLKALEKRLREPERIVMKYQVWKREITRYFESDEEDKEEQQMIKEFWSLAEANKYASGLVLNKMRTCAYISLKESNKNGRYKAVVAHDTMHESQVFIVEMPIGPGELSPEFVSSIPKRFQEKFWDVMQFTSKTSVNVETAYCNFQAS